MSATPQTKPKIFIGSGKVLENRCLAASTFLLTIHCPEVASQALPGSFIKLRAWPSEDLPLLDRPLSIHRVRSETVQILYRVVGSGTALISQATVGQSLKVSGPLGRSLAHVMPQPDPMYLVGGGIGLAPLALVKDWMKPANSHLFYGERSWENQVDQDWLNAWAGSFTATTEDGSGYGQKGLVVNPLSVALKKEPRPIFACGPLPMLRAVSQLAAEFGVPAWVSLEAGMACGFGICLTCSLPLKGGGRFRVCQEGPVMDGTAIDWEKLG